MNIPGNNLRINGPAEEIASGFKADRTDSKSNDVSFKDLLKGIVDQVDSLQKDANASINGLVTGETTDIHDVTIKMEEAGVAFELMLEVRNKLVEAYQQLIKMQS